MTSENDNFFFIFKVFIQCADVTSNRPSGQWLVNNITKGKGIHPIYLQFAYTYSEEETTMISIMSTMELLKSLKQSI